MYYRCICHKCKTETYVITIKKYLCPKCRSRSASYMLLVGDLDDIFEYGICPDFGKVC